jgi:hypothetical protein
MPQANRTARPRDIAGAGDIAAFFHVTGASVSNWRKRYPDFPAPWATVSSGPIWIMADVIRWCDRHRWSPQGGHGSL